MAFFFIRKPSEKFETEDSKCEYEISSFELFILTSSLHTYIISPQNIVMKGTKMIRKSKFPILNFDDNKKSKLTVQKLDGKEKLDIDYGVICFDMKTRERFAKDYPSRIINTFKGSGIAPLNIYVVNFNGIEIILHQGVVGAALSAAVMEDLAAFGCKKVIAVGSAGVLKPEITRGHLIIPTSAVRQEGASYHYVAPSKYIKYSPKIIDKMCKCLKEKNLPFVCGKTWTTDGVFRETQDLIDLRGKEGCVCVEMENAALGAVAQFYNIKFGQILYGADCLSGDIWDKRDWANEDIKQRTKFALLKLAMEMVTKI